jgi:hypothetical protein
MVQSPKERKMVRARTLGLAVEYIDRIFPSDSFSLLKLAQNSPG